MTLEEVSKAVFDDCMGQSFALMTAGGQVVEAELIAVDSLGSSATFKAGAPEGGSVRESFSLLFRTPRNWRGPQRTYTITHPKLGELEVFLVPIGPDERGMRLEAIFNFTSSHNQERKETHG